MTPQWTSKFALLVIEHLLPVAVRDRADRMMKYQEGRFTWPQAERDFEHLLPEATAHILGMVDVVRLARAEGKPLPLGTPMDLAAVLVTAEPGSPEAARCRSLIRQHLVRITEPSGMEYGVAAIMAMLVLGDREGGRLRDVLTLVEEWEAHGSDSDSDGADGEVRDGEEPAIVTWGEWNAGESP